MIRKLKYIINLSRYQGNEGAKDTMSLIISAVELYDFTRAKIKADKRQGKVNVVG